MGSKSLPFDIQQIADKLAIVASDFAKVRLERVYDSLAQTGPINRLKNMPIGAKHLLETVAYFSHAIMAGKVKPDSAIGKFFAEIADDIPAEMGRRIINGDLDPYHELETPDPYMNSKLASLSDDEIKKLANWFSGASDEEKMVFAEKIKRQSIVDLQLFIRHDDKTRAMIEYLEKKKKPFAKEIGFIAAQIDGIRQSASEARTVIEKRRIALREKRLGGARR